MRPKRKRRAKKKQSNPKARGRVGTIPGALSGGNSGYGKTKCPKCGKRVYFVRPYSGGAVWFDDMGKPWPKHPCMDSVSGNVKQAVAFVELTRRYDSRDDWSLGVAPRIEAEAEVADLILSGVSLAGLDLHGIRFERVSLRRATFSGCNLKGANFVDCDISFAKFYSASLQDTRIRGGRMEGTRFDKADLTGATAVDIDVSQASFVGATMPTQSR